MTDRSELLRALLKGKPPSAFSAKQLGSKAHWRWDRDQHLEAFVLFDAADVRSREEGTWRGERRNRAATTLYRSGESTDEALQRIDEVLAWYGAHPEDTYDHHWVQHAWWNRLHHAFESAPETFRATFQEAVAYCATTGPWRRFPVLRPLQDDLLDWAVKLEARAVARHVIEQVRQREKLTRKLARRLDELEAWAREP